MESPEQYYKIDTWPPEQDRTLFMRMASEVPILESTIVTILAIGISKELPLSPSEAFDLTEQIVKRAASIHNPIIPVLKGRTISFNSNIFLFHSLYLLRD